MSTETEVVDIKITFNECANCCGIYNCVSSIIDHIQSNETNGPPQKGEPKILSTVILNAHIVFLCSNCIVSFTDFRKSYKTFNLRTSGKSAISNIFKTTLPAEVNNNPNVTVTNNAFECDTNLQVTVNISRLTPRELIANNVNLATVQIFLRKSKTNKIQKDIILEQSRTTRSSTRIQTFSSLRKVRRSEFQRPLNKVQNHATTKSTENVDTVEKCDFCEKSFRSLHGLNQHIIKQHSKERPIKSYFKCNYCTVESYQNISLLREHLKELHPDTNEFKAAGKNAEFNQKVEMLKHKSSVKATLLKKFKKCRSKCFLCDQHKHTNKSQSKFDLQFHIEKNHMSQNFPEFVLQCEMCGKTFTTNRDLSRHYSWHISINMDEKFLCELCGQYFRFRSILDIHRSFVHGLKNRKKFRCGKCTRYFYCRSEKDHHWITKHKVRAKFTCKICGRGFLRSETARRHKITNHNARKFGPTQNKVLGEYTLFDLDLTKCYCDIDKLYKCPVCEMKFGRKDHFLRHLPKHHEMSMFFLRNKNNKLKCSMCDVTTQTKEELVIHLRTHLKYNRQSNVPVSQEPIFQCEFCSKILRRPKFRNHWKSHKETRKMDWQTRVNSGVIIKKSGILLNVVDESYNQKGSNQNKSFKRFGKDVPRKNDRRKRHGCEFCGRIFSSNANLTSHKNYKHTKQNRFTCSFCKMKFAYASYLLYHLRNKHGSKKPIMCPYENCLATYSNKTDLQRHQQNRHVMEINKYKASVNNSLNINAIRQIISGKTKQSPRCQSPTKETVPLVKNTKNKTVKEFQATVKEPAKRRLRPCPHKNCNKRFYWKKVLIRHLRRFHNEKGN